MKPKTDQLEFLRNEIDEVDRALVGLLVRRLEIVRSIDFYKKQNSIPALDKARMNEILKTRTDWAKRSGLNGNLVKDIFSVIHGYCLRIQK